jgi:hypothetical protein
VVGGGVDRKAAPSAADVEDTLPGGESQVPADKLELLPLCIFERSGATGEDRAAVGHRSVEEERKELVRDLVVVSDRGAVTGAAVSAPS